MNNKFRKLLLAMLVSCGLGSGGAVFAAGFALIEQSASGMGNAFAGAAATAEDASTIFFNPAGMAFLHGRQAVVAAHVIDLSVKFSNSASSKPAAVPGLALGGTGGDAGGMSFVPNAYFTMPVNESWAIGVGINAPFGLKTEYDDPWLGRFQGLKSDITTLNINPSVSWKVSDTLALGFGVNYQQIDAELTNAVVLGANSEGRAKVKADDTAFGYNLGGIFQVTEATRIGVAYRSKIKYTLEGDTTVTTYTTAPGTIVPSVSGPTKADLTLPASMSISVVHDLSEQWRLLGDITYTNWSSVDTLNVMNSSTGATRDQLVLKFDNAYRFSLGATYKASDQWSFKVGAALDQSPVNDQYRSVRLPDNDRTWLSMGAKYSISKATSVDIGYTHIFIKDAPINNARTQYGQSAATFTSVVNGNYTGSVDVLSVQLAASF